MPTNSSDETSGKKRGRGAVAVAQVLREDILTLRLAPGSALDEIALSQRFGLSRTPIREALLVLSGDGLVTFLQNRTTIVTPHTMSNSNDYLDALALLSRAVFRQAAERWRCDDIRLLATRLDELDQSIADADVDRIEAADIALRRAICAMTNNLFYERYYPDCIDSGRRALRLHYYPFASAQQLGDYLATFQELIRAIETRDEDRCDALALVMISSVVEVMQQSLLPGKASRMDLSANTRPKPSI